MRPNNIRIWLHGLSAVLILTLLVACGGQTAADVPTPEPQVIENTVIVERTVVVEVTPTPDTMAAAETSTPQTMTRSLPDSDITGEVVVYTSRAETLFNPVLEAFNAAYPNINVTLLSGSNSELAARILEERSNPQADVLINSDLLTMESLAAEGIFAPSQSEVVMSVPDAYRADDGGWVALTLRARVIMYNTELVDPEDVPTSLLDLTDPRWAGQVGAPQSTNGATMANLVVMRELLGEERTEQFMRDMVANGTQFFGGHTDIRKAVGAGELQLGWVNHYYYHLSLAEGAPVGVIYPDQGEGEMGIAYNSTNAGIINGGPNPDIAQLFVEFMLTPEGQQVYAEQNFEYPILPGIELAEGVAPLEEFRLVDLRLRDIWGELEPTRALAQQAGYP